MAVRNLDEIRAKDVKLYEALSDIIGQHANTSSQTNSNPTGQPLPPPSISGINVVGANGHFQVAIKDEGQIYRGVNYYVEHSSNPDFTDPHIVDMGSSRNIDLPLGNVTRYFRAYSSYGSSPPGSPAYHGHPASPQAVVGGGALGGPDFLPSEGSGTGTPGQGISGPGPVPFRSDTGEPPIRGENAGPTGSIVGSINPAELGIPSSFTPTGGPSGGGGGGGGGIGTVTSVALTAPVEFTVSGSPITSSGTLAITKAVETANTVWAGPTTGAAAQPTFRALVNADLPTAAVEPANFIYAGPTSGSSAVPTFRAAVVDDYPFHDESLTDGASNFIFAGGDVVTVVGIPN